MSRAQIGILLANFKHEKAKWAVAEYKVDYGKEGYPKFLEFVSPIKEVSLASHLMDEKTGEINSNGMTALINTIKGFKQDYTNQGIRNVRKAYIGMPVETREVMKHNEKLLRQALTLEYKTFRVAPWFEALGGYFESPNALLIEADYKTTIYVKLNNQIANEYTIQCLGYDDFSKAKELAKNGLMSSVTTAIGKKVVEFKNESQDQVEVIKKLRGLLDQTKNGLFKTITRRIGQTALELSKETRDNAEFLEKFREFMGQDKLSLSQGFYQAVQGILGLGINLDLMRDELFDGDAGLPKTIERMLGEVDLNLKREVASNVKIFGKLTYQIGFSELVEERLKPVIGSMPEIIKGEDIEMNGLLKYADGKI